MTRRHRNSRLAFIVAGLAILAGTIWWLSGQNIAVLNPAGTIASQERGLMATAVLLGMLVIVPVYILTVVIVWRYRITNPRHKKYRPDWDHSRWLEGFWWAVPLIIVTILSIVTWQSSYSLDPFKPLVSPTKPITIQVVALNWKWLFIYPNQKVASVNEVQLPVHTPINFQITSDTVMNSFWIPQLGGQIYAMPGMGTELHLMAGKAGDYIGSSANISGSGFANMAFRARAESPAAFDGWVRSAAKNAPKLDLAAYKQLARPGTAIPIKNYALASDNIYDYVIMKYMTAGGAQ